jgi:NADH dehydrogenase/NADH:ubiquinone oxidoreductase subunit G
LTVDGRPAKAKAGQTILDVCRPLGKDIPTLCHHASLEPYAACRVCLVEITAGGRVGLAPACQYPVSEGLAVATDSPAVRSARRVVLELLLARCPGNKVIRDLAARFGVTSTPYPSENPAENCILCGQCVRVCEQLVGTSAIGFSQRGIERRVTAPFDETSERCIGCMACVAVCPTGHILSVDDGAVRKMVTWKTDVDLIRCESCGEPFAGEKMMELVRAKLPARVKLEKYCEKCRRTQTARRLSKASARGKPLTRAVCGGKKRSL